MTKFLAIPKCGFFWFICLWYVKFQWDLRGPCLGWTKGWILHCFGKSPMILKLFLWNNIYGFVLFKWIFQRPKNLLDNRIQMYIWSTRGTKIIFLTARLRPAVIANSLNYSRLSLWSKLKIRMSWMNWLDCTRFGFLGILKFHSVSYEMRAEFTQIAKNEGILALGRHGWIYYLLGLIFGLDSEF